MTGNEFLKHSPHKNRGDFPYQEYNRLRFQMGAAKIPYVKRVYSNGILEVMQIYGNSYTARWTPIGGDVVYFVVRYKDKDGDERVVLLDQAKVLVGDYANAAFTSDSVIYEDPLVEWKVNDSLICFLTVDPDAPDDFLIKFYYIGAGAMDTYSFSITSKQSASVVHKWNMYTQPLQPTFFNMFVEDEVVYIVSFLTIDTITITKNPTTGAYTFTEDSYTAPSSTVVGATTYDCMNLHFEEDELFLLLSEHGQIVAYPEINGIAKIEKSDGSILSTHIRSGIDVVVTPDSADNQISSSPNEWLASLPFGSPVSGLEPPPSSTIVRAVSTVPNVCIYENLTYAPEVGSSTYKGVELYTYEGVMLYYTTSYPTLYVHTGHLLVTTVGYWKDITEEAFHWLQVHALDNPPEDGAVIHDYYNYNAQVMTEALLKTEFLVPSDALELISISYMPGAEKGLGL